MTEPIIQIEQLGKMYRLGEKERYYVLRDVIANLGKKKPPTNEFWALKNIDLQVKQGEAVGIIGRNGAGKSTLLKILSQITPPTTGKIALRGRVASLLEIGTGFHPELTGQENIYLNGAILGMTRHEIKQKFNDIIKFAEIDKFLDTPVKHYSSGMRVRLAFAVAAHLEPEILIVDEVLSVGDAEFQKKCLGKMDNISKEGRTVLFVSHNMHSIRSLCSRAILLEQGRIAMDGNVNSVINRYENYYTPDIALVDWQDHGPTIPSAQLLKIGALSNNQPSGAEVATEQPLQIYIIFKVKTPAKVGTTILVHNQEGQLLFFSVSNHEPNWHSKMRPAGTYRSVCTIPANLLSPGRYSISVGLWEGAYPVERWEGVYDAGVIERDVLHLIARSDGLVRGDIANASDYGLITPLLPWISYLENNE